MWSTDRSGISDTWAVEQLQEGLIRALRSLITRRRPDDTTLFPKLLLRLPDLRTLNNLHSDKLLAFRIDPWSDHMFKDNTQNFSTQSSHNTFTHEYMIPIKDMVLSNVKQGGKKIQSSILWGGEELHRQLRDVYI